MQAFFVEERRGAAPEAASQPLFRGRPGAHRPRSVRRAFRHRGVSSRANPDTRTNSAVRKAELSSVPCRILQALAANIWHIAPAGRARSPIPFQFGLVARRSPLSRSNPSPDAAQAGPPTSVRTSASIRRATASAPGSL
jgi:hypothetical protein